MVTTQSWTLHQLDIKKAFLNGELSEEFQMEQPPRFVATIIVWIGTESTDVVW